MEERASKTIMCSVMMLDIVGYSKRAVSEQITLKEIFNTMLANAIQHVPADDRVILDTGDGAAVSFLGDVEDALKAALAFRETLLSEGPKTNPPLEVCMGINLGPVRIVTDINGRPNIVGDGINAAQRVMAFANPGALLVSRSYFDAASRLSQEYAGLFYSEGVHKDKHGREHEIYAIGKPGDAAGGHKGELGVAVKQSAAEAAEGKLEAALTTFQKASGQQRAMYAGVAALALILLIVVLVKIVNRPEAPAPQATAEAPASQVAVAPVAAPVAPEAAPASLQEEVVVESGVKSTDPNAIVISTKTVDQAETKKAEPAETKKQKAARLADAAAQKKQETAAKEITTEAAPVATATVRIVVVPWGEVYLDGKKQGVSPPLDVLHVTPGAHEIEIRNTSFPPHVAKIDVKAGEEMKIKYKF